MRENGEEAPLVADLWLKADCDKQNFHDGKVFCIELDVTRAKDTYCVIMIFAVPSSWQGEVTRYNCKRSCLEAWQT